MTTTVVTIDTNYSFMLSLLLSNPDFSIQVGEVCLCPFIGPLICPYHISAQRIAILVLKTSMNVVDVQMA